MAYTEYKPSQRLEGVIDSFWSFSDINPCGVQRILPDGCMDIIFDIANPHAEQPVFISGMMTTYSDVSFIGAANLLGIRFKPGQFSRITRFPLFEIKNLSADAQEIIPQFTSETFEQVNDFITIKDKLSFLETTLLKQLALKDTDKDTYILSLVNYILTSPEPIVLKELTGSLPVSIRQLERVFKARVGVTLKEFYNITRFTRAKRHIANNPDKSLLEIAFDHGYYDHAHFTNEFKKFSGNAPSLYR